MNTMSASRADQQRTLVWDAPVRVFHWLLAASFLVAWLSSESERWQLVHVTAGYTMAGLVVFRLLWGVIGTRYARFSDFVRGPWAAVDYLESIAEGRPEHHIGHNPAGGLAIVALLALALLTAATGWAHYEQVGGHWLEELHEGVATTLLGLVLLHLAAVAVSSLLHRENLVGAMLHGRKRAPASAGIRGRWRSVAVLLLAAVLGFWWLQWQSAPEQPPVAARHHGHRH